MKITLPIAPVGQMRPRAMMPTASEAMPLESRISGCAVNY